jgi:hypothetical protein
MTILPESNRSLVCGGGGLRIVRVRTALLAMAAVLASCAVACGGDDSGGASALTLEQRLLRESEAPGTEPDPRETRIVAGSLDEFASSPDYVVAADIERSKLEAAGFVSAVQDTRFYPKAPGASHTGEEPHVRMLVARFESEDGAREGADLLREKSLEPCPETCAQRITEFDVSRVPDARGVRHYTSAAELEATGEPGEPFDSYEILFTDGSFAYDLEVFGPPGEVSQKQVEEIAGKVYERVRGAPAPGA